MMKNTGRQRGKSIQRKEARKREVFIKKILIGAVSLILVTGAVFAAGGNFAQAGDRAGQPVQHKYYKSIEIQPGDTLWSIAETYRGDQYDSIGSYISELMSVNHLGTDEINAGEYLSVPYYEAL